MIVRKKKAKIVTGCYFDDQLVKASMAETVNQAVPKFTNGS
jgi:hypothetical protein